MKQPISKLKEWFGAFKTPTAGQFGDMMDSFVHKDLKIPASQVEGWTDDSAIEIDPDQRELPELGDKNKTLTVLGGAEGKIFTYKGLPFPVEADHQTIFFWASDLRTWKVQDDVALPKQDLTKINEKIATLERDTTSSRLMLSVSADDLTIFMDNDGNAVGLIDKNSKLVLMGLQKPVQDEISELWNQPRLLEEKMPDLYTFVDLDKNAIAKIDQESQMRLFGLDGSVQENLNMLKDITLVNDTTNGDLVISYDKVGNMIFRIDSNSKMFLTGLQKSVQDEIILMKKGYALNSKIDNSQYKQLTNSAREQLSTRLIYGLTNFPPPHGVLPQKWTFPITEIPALRAPVVSEYVTIGMYNGMVYNANSGVVHPNIFEFDFPVNGYRYWMTLNGYPNEAWEITWLFCTNDPEFKNWTLMSDCPQPFEDNPKLQPPYISSHDSDSFITYNPLTGEIVVAWRRTMRWHPSAADGQTNEYRCRTSINGVDWSEVKQLIKPVTADVDLMQSMGIIFNPDDSLFYAFDVANTPNGWKMKWKTNKDLMDIDGWSDHTFIAVPQGVVPWHLDVKYIGGTIVILLHENQNVSPGQDRLWFCATNDLQNFTWSSGDILGGTTPLYKSTFIPVYNNNGTMKFKIAYTTDERALPASEQWRLKITETQSFNI